MPCDTVQKSSVNLELKADNKTYLIAALKSLGYLSIQDLGETVRFVTRDGIVGLFAKGTLNLTSRGQAAENFNTNPIKRAYSVEVVKGASKKFGWNLQADKQEQFKFTAQKRGM